MLNLIINAVEAMIGVSEGTRELVISTGKDESGGVLVGVRDSGPGLSRHSARYAPSARRRHMWWSLAVASAEPIADLLRQEDCIVLDRLPCRGGVLRHEIAGPKRKKDSDGDQQSGPAGCGAASISGRVDRSKGCLQACPSLGLSGIL
jgi:hypothetical protein